MITLPVFTYDKDVDGYHIPPTAPLAVIRPMCKVSWITQGHRLGLKEKVKRGKGSTVKAVLGMSSTLSNSESGICNPGYFYLLCYFYLCASFFPGYLNWHQGVYIQH